MGARVSQEAKDAIARVMAGEPVITVARSTGLHRSTIDAGLKRMGLVAPVQAKRGRRARALPLSSD